MGTKLNKAKMLHIAHQIWTIILKGNTLSMTENRALIKCADNREVCGEEIPYNDIDLSIMMDDLESAYLLHMLAHQKEVIPVPSGDSVVHYGARGCILKTFLIYFCILKHKTAHAVLYEGVQHGLCCRFVSASQ
jgi:hypothetical protein